MAQDTPGSDDTTFAREFLAKYGHMTKADLARELTVTEVRSALDLIQSNPFVRELTLRWETKRLGDWHVVLTRYDEYADEGGEQRLLAAPIFIWNARPASGGLEDELNPPIEAYESVEDAFSEAVETIMTREPDAAEEAQP
jgi:hypothetical protein